MIKRLLFCLALTNFQNSYGQKKDVQEFIGTWRNTQLEYVEKYEPGKGGTEHITPTHLLIDSSGHCTIILRFEQKADAGKPYIQRSFGPVKQLIYRHWGEMYLTQIVNNDSLIALSSSGNGMSIVFRKIE